MSQVKISEHLKTGNEILYKLSIKLEIS